jgi:hypothetical protein
MKSFGFTEHSDGHCSFMLDSARAVDLVPLFEADGSNLYVECSTGSIGGWRPALIPLVSSRLTSPQQVRVRRVSYEALMPLEMFAQVANEIGHDGIFVAQVKNDPPVNEYRSYEDMPDPARKQWREAVGLSIAILLPHADESAMVVAPNRASAEAALQRI